MLLVSNFLQLAKGHALGQWCVAPVRDPRILKAGSGTLEGGRLAQFVESERIVVQLADRRLYPVAPRKVLSL